MCAAIASVMVQQPFAHIRTGQEQGTTNNCCLKVDGSERLFGEQPFRIPGVDTPRWPGRWTEMEADLGKDPNGVPRQGKV